MHRIETVTTMGHKWPVVASSIYNGCFFLFFSYRGATSDNAKGDGVLSPICGAVSERVSKQNLASTLHVAVHFGDKSFQAVNCTGTDDQTHSDQEKIHKKKTKTSPNINKLALVKKRTQTQPKPKPAVPSSPLRSARVSMLTTVHDCDTQNSSANVHSYPADSLHWTDAVCRRAGAQCCNVQ